MTCGAMYVQNDNPLIGNKSMTITDTPIGDYPIGPQKLRVDLARQYVECAQQHLQWAREHLERQLNTPDPKETNQ